MEITILRKDRKIFIKDALTDSDKWIELFESLTFNEGLALMKAIQQFSSKFMVQNEEK